ncbi:hypothetical protein [Acidovorax sp. Leaf78]|uniref:hypothetical protein n=1 Tax=Acidovorax sp. Leaf78 TaxID=1736237 RepID=UPI000ABEB596|nr:hypothetical protein [Acidovorax sp. Leaf78]
MHVNFIINIRLCLLVGTSILLALYALFSAFPLPSKYYPSSSSDLASWFQFIGGLAAVGVAIYFSSHQQRVKQREDEHVAYVTAINLLSNITINTIQLKRTYLLLNSSMESTKYRAVAEEWEAELGKIIPPSESQFLNIARSASSGGVLLAEAWGEIDYLKRCVGLWTNVDLPKLIGQRNYSLVQVAHQEYTSQFTSICRDILVAHEKAEIAIKNYCYKHPMGRFSNGSTAN